MKQIRDHALIYALCAKEICSAVKKEKAEALIEEITVSYGIKRGERMRKKAEDNHEKADINAYLIHGEWKGRPHENESVMEFHPDSTVSRVSRCAWYDTWKQYGLEEYGRYYCRYIDKALCKGFDGSFDLQVESVLSHGDPECRFVWSEAADQIYVQERKNENKDRYILPFDFHVEEFLQCASAVLEQNGLSQLIAHVMKEYDRLNEEG